MSRVAGGLEIGAGSAEVDACLIDGDVGLIEVLTRRSLTRNR